MSHDATQQHGLDEARSTHAQKREACALLLMEVAASQAEWQRLKRAGGNESAEAKAAESSVAQKIQELKTAREQERQARDQVVGALKQWLDGDLAEDIKTLSAQYPIILLPVRLETRFLPIGAPDVLKVRIYPDEIMADTHEPWLTEAERSTGEGYWRAFWKAGSLPSDQQRSADLVAWGQLLKRVLATRAAWIVHETEPTNLAERTQPGSEPTFPTGQKTRPHSWTRAAEAHVLPDRWLVLAYRNGKEVHRTISNVVVEPLALTINPTASFDDNGDAKNLLQDPDVGWTFDLDQAEQVGMAVSIELQAEDVANGFDRLIVVGVKASLNAEESGRRLAGLLETQHYTSGLAFVRQGTPTNNTGVSQAGFPPDDPGGARSFAVERESVALWPESDGYLWMTAMGLPQELAAHIAGADGIEQAAVRAMNDALWPVTLGYYLEQMLAPGRKPSEAPPGPSARIFTQRTIQEARNYFIEHVRGRGPYPAFRVGATPYGLLPVSSLDRWNADGQQPDPVPDLVMLLVENRQGTNEGRYIVGWNMDAAGALTGSWSEPKPVAGDFGAETRGAGIAIAPITGTDRPDLLVFHVEEQAGANVGFYRIGWGLDSQGQVDHWSDAISVPGDFGRKTEGASVAIADIDGDGRLDLVVFHVEREYITSPVFTGFGRNTRAYYRIGWRLDSQGQVDHWSAPVALPRSGFDFDRPGAAFTVGDVDGDGYLDLVVLGFMDPTGRFGQTNQGYYRIGWKLDTQGQVDHWGDSVLVQGPATRENLGAGIAVTDLDRSGQADLVVFNIDRPQPGDKKSLFCQIGWNLDKSGVPTKWSDVGPVPASLGTVQGAGLALANLSDSRLTALRMLRDLWKEAARQVPRIGRTGDPDQDLLEMLGMEASAREVRVRTILGGDLLLNLYNYRGTSFFKIDWSTWSQRQQQLMDEALKHFAALLWDERLNLPARLRIGDMVLDEQGYLYREALVTNEPLSEERILPDLPGKKDYNYIDWIMQTPPVSVGGVLQGLMDASTAEWPLLLCVLLRQAMLLEYANAAFEMLVDPAVKLVQPLEQREPELIGIVAETINRLSVRERFLQTLPGSTRTVGEVLWRQPDVRGTEALERYCESLRMLGALPTAELERLLTETLDVCSHRLDAWITSLASQRLQEMRTTQAQKKTSGSYLAAFGWVENLRPAPMNRYTTETLNGGTVLVQNGSGGYIHAPSMAHATAAGVLRNGYLTRSGNDRKRYALDLSSERVRTARWLLDAVRDGQPLGAALGYRVERILHERQLEIYLDPLRASFPLVTVREPGIDGAGRAMMARNVVDGLALRTAWPEKVPWGEHGLPGAGSAEQQALRDALDAELGALDTSSPSVKGSLMDPLDAVADLLTAEAVYQLIRGNTAASVTSLDAMAQGLRPPDPEIARMPQGGTALTHRVALVLGKAVPTPSSSWPEATPRAKAEPLLDAWVGSLLGDPANVQCRVTYAVSGTANPQKWKERAVKLSELGLRPLDVLALAQGMQDVAQASELDQRVAYFVLSQTDAAEQNESQQLHIRYAAGPDWQKTTVRTFPELLEMARAINATIGGARPLRPEDVLPPEAATSAQQAVWEVDETAQPPDLLTLSRAREAYESLKHKATQLGKAIADLQGALDPDPAHPAPDLLALRQALEAVARFGLSMAVPGSAKEVSKALAEALLAQAGNVRREIERRLDRAGEIKGQLDGQITAAHGKEVPIEIKIQAATDILQAIFGRNFVVLTGFQPAEAVPGELSQALQAEPELVDESEVKRANSIRKWFQQATHVRPALERWRKLWLYAGALGTGQPQWQVMQLPFRSGERWVGLPFTSEVQRPLSGRVSLILHRTASLKAAQTWAGLLLDEWNEVIPNRAEVTGVAFHYDDPGAEAPQAVLVAVPPRREGNWDLETLLAILNETLDMAQTRAVDSDVLGPLAQVLPAIVLATNTANDTVSTDFSALRRTD